MDLVKGLFFAFSNDFNLWEKLKLGVVLEDGAIKMNSRLLPDLELEEWKQWEHLLKEVTTLNQGNLCASCGGKLTTNEQHHALVSRSDVMGMPKKKRMRIIHHSYNVLVVHSGGCHENCTRLEAIEYLINLWGVQNVVDWYESIPFRSKRAKLL